MSRKINPEAMTADDVAYVRQRPLLRQEFMMQGYGDPLAEDYPGLVDSNPDSGDGDGDNGQGGDPADGQQGDPQNPDPDGDPDGTEEEGLPEAKRWNAGMSKAELRAVIEARNADYDDDEKIVMPEEDKKDPLVAALKADDEELFGTDDGDEA